jgi:hypothetical protein
MCCSTFVNLRRNLCGSEAALARIEISKPGEGESVWNSHSVGLHMRLLAVEDKALQRIWAFAMECLA